MTDYSPGALEDLKKKIAHAAIKWTMYEEPVRWDGDAESGFYGASWEGRLPPVSGPTGSVQLKWYPPGLGASAGMPPGCHKTGDGSDAVGQSYITYEVDPWTSIYSPWIERIDAAFEGWDSIPDPDAFAGRIDRVRAAVLALTPLPKGAGGNDEEGEFEQTYTGVDLTGDLDTMHQFIGADTAGADEGLLIYAFQNSYGPERIRGVMGNQAQAAIVLGISLLAEQKIWEGAQQDIMAIASRAVECFQPGGGGGGSIDLKVVKAFVDLLATFAPPQVKPVLATGSAGISLVEAVMPKKTGGEDQVKIDGYTPDEVYNSLVDVIGKLEQRVFDQEFEVAYTTLDGMIGDMHSMDAGQFHIHPRGGIDPELAKAGKLSVHPDYLRKIGYQTVPSIAAVMGHAAEDAQGADNGSMWVRANQIGLGNDGPYPKWSELLGLFDAVTTGSGKELVEAGQLLAIGAGWLEDSDHDAQTALHGVQDDLDRGALGWDNSVPLVNTGPGGMPYTPGPHP
jgi:hypothetical protein